MQKIEYGSTLHVILNQLSIAQAHKGQKGFISFGPFSYPSTTNQVNDAIRNTWAASSNNISGADWVDKNGKRANNPQRNFPTIINTVDRLAQDPFPVKSDVNHVSRIMYGDQEKMRRVAQEMRDSYTRAVANPDPTFETDFFINFQAKAYLVICGHVLAQAAFMNLRIAMRNKFDHPIPLTLNVLPSQAHYKNLRANKAAWDDIREVIMDGALHECEVCDSESNLQVHEEWDFCMSPCPPVLPDNWAQFMIGFISADMRLKGFESPESVRTLIARFNATLIKSIDSVPEFWDDLFKIMPAYYMHQSLQNLECLCEKCHSFKHINGTTDRNVKQYGKEKGLRISNDIILRAVELNGLNEEIMGEYIENCSQIAKTIEQYANKDNILFLADSRRVTSIIASKSDSYSKKLERRKLVDDGYGSF